MRVIARLLVLSGVLAAGCAAPPKNPSWLEELNQVECAGQVTSECVLTLSSTHLAKSANSPFMMSGTLHYVAAAELNGLTWVMPEPLGTEDRLAVNSFSSAMRAAYRGEVSKAIAEAKSLGDSEARRLALYFISLSSLIDGTATGAYSEAIESLHHEDMSLYRQAMMMRLENLLAIGDLERSHALRQHLLKTADISEPNLAPDINDIALVYARTGMLADLGDWVGRLSRRVPELGHGDEATLRGTMIKAALGESPGPEILGGIKRAETRFAAYLELARLYRLLGNNTLEKRAIQDAALYSQMSSISLDRPLAVEYLSLMLLESKSL